MSYFIPFLCFISAAALSAVIGLFLIPLLRRFHFGQTILTEYGPSWHASKQGTPLMGGLMFMISTVCIYMLFAVKYYSEGLDGFTLPTGALTGLIVACLFALIGFADDYVKVKKKQNLGLTAIQKIILQVIISAAYILYLGVRHGWSTSVQLPFIGTIIDLGFFYYILALIIMVGFVNAVNLTDGVDGLCGSVTFVVAAFFTVVAVSVYNSEEDAILFAALAGSLIGFLIFNWHPAKVFMGDTGSMFLGGMVIVMGFELNMPLVILLAGLIYLIEAFSVIIQVIYFKLTHGKRLFKMTPIHHHFELSGYSEVKIVLLFSGVTLLVCAATALWLLI